MRSATYEVIDIFERVLTHLASWYPPQHFNEQSADAYFSAFIASRFQWHRALYEPTGPGSGGTMASVLAAAGTMDDVANAVADIVAALQMGQDLDYKQWERRWAAAADEPKSSLIARIESAFSRWFP
jgi:hypothetical protein